MPDNIIKIHPNNDPKKSSRFWPDWRKVKRNCAILLIVLFIVYIAFNIGVYYFFESVKLAEFNRNPEALKLWRDFVDSTVTIPKEWENLRFYSFELKSEEENLWNQWNEINQKERYTLNRDIDHWNKTIFDPSQSMTKEDWKEIEEILLKCDSFIRAGREISDKLKILILSNPSTKHVPSYIENSYYTQEWSELIQLQAFYAAHEGRITDGLDGLFATLPLYAKSPFPKLGEYVSQNYYIPPFLTNVQTLIGNVWNPSKLQTYLSALNQWEPYIFRMKKEEARIYGLFSSLIENNIPIAYGVERKVSDYTNEIKNKKYPQKSISQIIDKLQDMWNEEILAGGQRNPYAEIPRELDLMRPFVITNALEEYYTIKIYVDDTSIYFERENEAANHYDELRLEIAARLYFLKNDKLPSSPADLVPDYFPQEIVNRENGNRYRWNDKGALEEIDEKEING